MPILLLGLQLLVVCLTLIAVDETIAWRVLQPFPCGERPFTCGQIVINSGHPFGVKGDPQKCSSESFPQLSCEHNRTMLCSGPNSNKYYVVAAAAAGYIGTIPANFIRVLDPGLQKNNCSTIPPHSFTFYDFDPEADIVIFVRCKKPVESPLYIDTAPCVTANEFSNQTSTDSIYSYVVFAKAQELNASNIEETCTIYRTIVSRFPSLDFSSSKRHISFQDIHDAMAMGFEIHYGTAFDYQYRCKSFII